MRNLLPLVIACALFMPMSLATPSLAAPSRSATVIYADLDLGGRAGAAALDRRIGRAIRALCGTPSAADLKDGNAVRRCRSEARSSVSAQRNEAIETARRQAAVTALAQ